MRIDIAKAVFVDDVSIHAPVCGANITIHLVDYDNPFQSTHPCGVRKSNYLIIKLVKDVSIHAPVWGANAAMSSMAFLQRFNPRTRVGCED